MKYLAFASLLILAPLANAFIIFEPLPTPNCLNQNPLPEYYQRQLIALNHPYGSPTVNLYTHPCGRDELNNYYRKSDLLPANPTLPTIQLPATGSIMILPFKRHAPQTLTAEVGRRV